MKEIKKTNLNDLGKTLIDFIKERKNIFETIHVVVPNIKVEQWFKSYWLKTQEEILMNVKFINKNSALLLFVDEKKEYSLMSKDIFKSFIIKNLLENKELELPREIKKYFEAESVDSIKLYDLSNKLCQVFTEYENDQFDAIDWQGQLYDAVLREASSKQMSTISYLYNKIRRKKVCDVKEKIYFFGFNNFTVLEQSILNNYLDNDNIVNLILCNSNSYLKEFSVTAVPSKLREIEDLHTKICKLINEQDIDYSDILVLAPDISLYENIISRVFEQDNVKFPNIPYTINDRKRIDTNLSLGLKKLFELINKKYFTRLDFFNLINNRDIQRARNITKEDVLNLSKAIVEMNAYRNSEDRCDWEYVKKRVLLSKVSSVSDNDNIIELGNQSYVPFSNIEFNDELIIKFVSIIDDLKSWNDCITNIKSVNEQSLKSLLNELDKWFSIKDKNGFEINGYYKGLTNLINNWILLGIYSDFIPLQTFVFLLYDVSQVTRVKTGDYFVKGITFADFDIDCILSSKYVFFLNAGSKELPKQEFKSELDKRDYDISKKEKIKNAFYLQYQNTEERFYISYINRNLKSDEELYLSSFVSELYLKINKESKLDNEKKSIPIIELSLDETREWSELFTKKSHKDKEYYVGLIEKNNSNNTTLNYNQLICNTEKRKKITVSEMAKFLEEPLQSKVSYLFSKDDSVDEDIKEEYEPFDLDALTKYSLLKSICLEVLKNEPYNVNKETINKLIRNCNMRHQLPDISDEINELSVKKTIELSQKLIDYIVAKTKNNFKIVGVDDVLLIDEFRTGETVEKIEWMLTCKDKVCRSVNGEFRTYIQIKKLITEDEDYEFLFLYIFSLMDLVSLVENENRHELDNTIFNIELCRGTSRNFKIKPSEAKDVLGSIYKLMNEYDENICVPNKLFNDNSIVSLNDFIKELIKKYGAWSFFKDKNIFDYDTQLGYTDENFLEKFSEEKAKYLKLIKFYNVEEK